MFASTIVVRRSSLKKSLRRSLCAAAALLSVALAAPAPARASVLWRGDFSTGDLSQWLEIQQQAPGRLTVVPSPAPPRGRYALRTEVQYGDLVVNGCRAELVSSMEVEGAERYYSWSTLIPTDYPTSSDWQVFTQWHHNGDTGSPPLEFDLFGGDAVLTTRGDTQIWRAPLARGVWHDFVFHVKFSPASTVGFVELWLDGAKVLGPTALATMYAGSNEGMWLKQGLYRNRAIGPTAVIYHSGMVKGETLADVAPWLVAPPPPPPADFSVAVARPQAPIAPGGVASFAVTVASGASLPGPVQLSASGLPAFATAPPATSTGGSSVFSVATSPQVPPGSYTFTITATSGGIARQTTATLDVAPAAATADPALAAAGLHAGGCSSSGPSLLTELLAAAAVLLTASWKRRRAVARAAPPRSPRR